MKRTYDLYYKGEHYTRYTYSLEAAKIQLAGDLLVELSEIKTDFMRDEVCPAIAMIGIPLTLVLFGWLLSSIIF